MSGEPTQEQGSAGDGTSPSLGRYLQSAREKKKLSLEEVAHTTKIRKAILDALERDAFRELPEKVFVMGYVRSYAAAVGLSVEEALGRFRAAWVEEEPDELEVDAPRPLPGHTNFGWVIPAIAALIAAGVIWLILSSV